ncbi:MAG: macromolecule metabolism [Gemmatimonadetes bacterium]|nr:macromolecule metabolism [Gemmatimonadota bacterium]
MRHARGIALGLLGAVVVLVAVVVARTLRVPASPSVTRASLPAILADSGAVERLAGAVRIPTVTTLDQPVDVARFDELHAFLAQQFPRAHAAMTREILDTASLLFTWKGTDASLSPVVLMAHQDVVPVEAGTEAQWTHPPFSGDLAEGFVWGRGTLDDKGNVMAILEAAEALAKRGFAPRRTLMLSFGHDEERGGSGALAVVAELERRGVHPSLVVDEGGVIADDLLPGMSGRRALVGITEKGYMSVRLTARAEGGHSSMPPQHTAVGILARALDRLENDPMPSRIDGGTRAMFEQLAPDVAFGRRMIFANLWLFDPLLRRILAGTPSSNAMIRTTTAPTMLEASPKDNVLAQQAKAVVNFRLLPGDSVATVMRHIAKAVNDPRVVAEPLEGLAREPAPVSPSDSPEFHTLTTAIGDVFGVSAVPYLVVGGTDARAYSRIARNVYRFSPFAFGKSDLARLHGTNERVPAKDYLEAIRFYQHLIELSTK